MMKKKTNTCLKAFSILALLYDEKLDLSSHMRQGLMRRLKRKSQNMKNAVKGVLTNTRV